jgi:hypothetical protein
VLKYAGETKFYRSYLKTETASDQNTASGR